MGQGEKKISLRLFAMLFILGFVNAVMYTFPYVRYVFYDQQIAAMNITNTQSGYLMSIYSISMMISMIPGGILADKFSVKKSLTCSILGSVVIIVIYALTMNFAVACLLWFLVGLTTNFVFWCAITKAVGMVGSVEQQGICYGIYYASSGIISAILNAVCLWASSFSKKPAQSFIIAIWVMAIGTLLAALLVILFFKEKEGNFTADEENRFKITYVKDVLKNPITWLMSIMIMSAYGLYTSVSYFSPYLKDVMGISLVSSSLISIVRSNLMNLLCPVGGLIIDKIFKSATKWYVCAFGITCAIYVLVMTIPSSINPSLATFISLLPSAIAMMLYGVIWSCLKECKFKPMYTGTVIGIASIIGYLPDFFYYVIFGKWMDLYGNAAYKMIFGYLLGTAIIGMIAAILIHRISHKKLSKEI
ncbi:MFS transporter [Clostridium oryzae]|uniref:Inner membrane protein YqcE n=1 Tax=Clostridium oryzae TaxID=1450648 RepID=A0A1V4IDE9_9CLOT|nr:MFS transporter [Clostridium oryzae]OPJ58022.1 inner membrane protein YqcE [Clostridium oryzae]